MKLIVESSAHNVLKYKESIVITWQNEMNKNYILEIRNYIFKSPYVTS